MNSKSKESKFSHLLLKGSTALVTGASKGIGREIARQICLAGANVIAVARNEADLLTLSAQFPEKVETWVMDATSSQFLEKLDGVKLDVLVNNIGTNRPKAFLDVSPEDYDAVFDLNVRSLYLITQRVVANMLVSKTQGSIVNISSQMGHIGAPNRSIYCASKHAVEGLTKALGVELASQGIRVNSVAPTFVETPLTKPMLEDPVFADYVMNNIPMKRLALEEDVANAVVYLASDLSSSSTGSCVSVDGGWTAQ